MWVLGIYVCVDHVRVYLQIYVRVSLFAFVSRKSRRVSCKVRLAWLNLILFNLEKEIHLHRLAFATRNGYGKATTVLGR